MKSIDGVVDSTSLTKEWIGLILLPLVSPANAAELLIAVPDSLEDKLKLTINAAVGSCIVCSFVVFCPSAH